MGWSSALQAEVQMGSLPISSTSSFRLFTSKTVIIDLSVNLPEYRRGLSGKRYTKTQSKLTFYADLAEWQTRRT